MASLFIHKCKNQMRNKSLAAIQARRRDRERAILEECYSVLKQKWRIASFIIKRDSELVSRIIYQWSIYCKLNKIRSRYNHQQENDLSSEPLSL